MGLEGTASLAIAVLDLKLVQGLRDAINAGMPKTGPLGTIPPGANPFNPRPRLKANNAPLAQVSPQAKLRPSPVIEPRQVIHPQPRVEHLPPECAPLPTAYVYEKPRCHVIEPPWRTLPFPHEEVVIIRPQVVQQRVDLIHKGMLLDLFM